jgi:hypothetical protein
MTTSLTRKSSIQRGGESENRFMRVKLADEPAAADKSKLRQSYYTGEHPSSGSVRGRHSTT